MTLSVNILVGARFNASQVAMVAEQLDLDYRVYTSSSPLKWPINNHKISFVPMPFRVGAELIGLRVSKGLREFDAAIFDYIASFSMRESDILHGWASFSLYSAKRHTDYGGKFVLDRACPHIDFQVEIMREESELLGVAWQPSSRRMVDRMKEEYDIADTIIVPSEYTRKTFVQRGVDASKIQIVGLGSNVTNAPVLHLNRSDGTSNSKLLVVSCIGGNVMRKGIYYLVSAWKKLARHDAVLRIKTSRSELRKVPVIDEIIQSTANIEVIEGSVDIVQFYQSTDIFCLPSVDDGFGMVVAEALQFGIPVICSENVGASCLITSGKNGFVVPARDSDAFAEALSKVLEDQNLLIQMKRNVVNQGVKQTNMAEELHKIYASV